MSPDPEDTALEEALRDDLPSPETSARVRRRLLAAGLAVGNGVAATSAAAAGAGVVGKGLALSWGFKLGALAVVAIPTVGLLVESNSEPQLAPPPNAAALASPARSPERAANAETVPAPQADVEAAMPEAPPPSRPSARTPAAEPNVTTEALPLRPSQSDFAAPAPAPAPDAAGKASSTLAEETRLLDSAFAELGAGNGARASLLIAEHQRRFPNGLLQKERERAKARLAEIYRGE